MDNNTFLSELQAIPQWVVHNGDKVPRLAADPEQLASPTNPDDWSDYTTAKSIVASHPGWGFGFVLTRDLGITCIDLDKPVSNDASTFQDHILTHFANTYAEYSMSGNGIHVWLRASPSTPDRKGGIRVNSLSTEVYWHARYIAMTFNPLPGRNLPMLDCGPQVQQFVDYLYGQQTSNVDSSSHAYLNTAVIDWPATKGTRQIEIELLANSRYRDLSGGWTIDANKDDSNSLWEMLKVIIEAGANYEQAREIFLRTNFALKNDYRKRIDYHLTRAVNHHLATKDKPKPAVVSDVPLPAWRASQALPVLHGPSIPDDPPVRWLIPGIIPDKHVTAIHAESNMGKTTFVLAFAARLGIKVLVITNEDTAGRYRARFEALGGTSENFNCVSTLEVPWLLSDIPTLEATLQLHKPALLIIDSLYSHSDPRFQIESKHRDAAAELIPLVKLADKYCPILIVHHDNKQDTRTGHQKSSGSHGIVSSIRHNVRISEDPDNSNNRIVNVFNTKVGPKSERGFVFQLRPDFKWLDADNEWKQVNSDELVRAGKEAYQPKQANARDEATLFLDLQLAQGPQLASVIKAEADKVKIAAKTLDRARVRAGIKSIQLGAADNYVYLWGRFDDSIDTKTLSLSMFSHISRVMK